MKIITSFFIVFTLLSCSSSKETAIIEDTILNKKIEIAESFSNDDKVVLILNYNDYLIDYLKKASENNFEIIRANSDISEEAFNSLFNDHILLDFTNPQYHNSDIKGLKIGIKTEIKELNEMPVSSSEYLENTSNYNITLSKPFISENERFALIAFSRGYLGALDGGISLYEKNNSEWLKIDTINAWIE